MKTYQLTSTSVKGGIHSEWSNKDWRNMRLRDGAYTVGGTGKDSSAFYCVYITFDPAALAALRAKSILSATLSITVKSGTIPKSDSEALGVGIKLNGDEGSEERGAAWTRTDSTGEASGSFSTGYLRVQTGDRVSASDTPLDIPLDSTVLPRYGYVIGPNSYSYKNVLHLQPTATLTVVVDESETFTVTYDANGGTGAPEAQTKITDEPLTLSSVVPTKSQLYRFTEWNTMADGSGDSYAPGGVYYGNADVTLYAQYKSATVVPIALKRNDGTSSTFAWVQVVNSEPVTLPTSKPTRTGYAFKEWNTKATGNGVSYKPGQTITYSPAVISNNSLYAIWVELTNSVVYVKGPDNDIHPGTVYVKGSDGEMYEGNVFVKGSDGEMHPV